MNSHATGVNAVIIESSRPARQPARQRRSAEGSMDPRAACASQGSSAAEATTPKRPWPHAPLAAGTTAYVAAAQPTSHGFAA